MQGIIIVLILAFGTRFIGPFVPASAHGKPRPPVVSVGEAGAGVGRLK